MLIAGAGVFESWERAIWSRTVAGAGSIAGFTADGKAVAMLEMDAPKSEASIVLYELATGREVSRHAVEGKRNKVYSVKVSEDTNWLLIYEVGITQNGFATLLSLFKKSREGNYLTFQQYPNSQGYFSSNSRWFAFYVDQNIIIVDLLNPTIKETHRVKNFGDIIFLDDPDWLLIEVKSETDNTKSLFQRSTGKLIHLGPGHVSSRVGKMDNITVLETTSEYILDPSTQIELLHIGFILSRFNGTHQPATHTLTKVKYKYKNIIWSQMDRHGNLMIVTSHQSQAERLQDFLQRNINSKITLPDWLRSRLGRTEANIWMVQAGADEVTSRHVVPGNVMLSLEGDYFVGVENAEGQTTFSAWSTKPPRWLWTWILPVVLLNFHVLRQGRLK